MGANPALPEPTTPEARLALRIAQLERAVGQLQRLSGDVVVPSVDALPSAGRRGRVLLRNADNTLWVDTGSVWLAV